MGRRATDVNRLAFSVAKVLQKETGTLGQVPTVGCHCFDLGVSQVASECTSGLNGLNWVYLLLDQNKVGIVI